MFKFGINFVVKFLRNGNLKKFYIFLKFLRFTTKNSHMNYRKFLWVQVDGFKFYSEILGRFLSKILKIFSYIWHKVWEFYELCLLSMDLQPYFKLDNLGKVLSKFSKFSVTLRICFIFLTKVSIQAWDLVVKFLKIDTKRILKA